MSQLENKGVYIYIFELAHIIASEPNVSHVSHKWATSEPPKKQKASSVAAAGLDDQPTSDTGKCSITQVDTIILSVIHLLSYEHRLYAIP